MYKKYDKNTIEIGTKYGQYKTISEIFYINKEPFVQVECVCGYNKNFRVYHLKTLKRCPRCAAKDFRKHKIGDKKHSLTLLEYIPVSPSHRRHCKLRCQCECGKIKDFWISEFGKIQTCGDRIHKKFGKEHPHYKGYNNITGTVFTRIKKGAQDRNITFNITIEYIDKLFIKQDGKCALTGLQLELYQYGTGAKYLSQQTASLDRIDSSQGYIEGNVQWIHKDVNFMKQDFDEKYFIRMCHLISRLNPLG